MTKTPWRSTVGAAAVDASGVDSFTVGGDLLDDIVCQAQLCVCILLHTYHPYNIHIHNNQVVHQTQSNFQDLTQMCVEYLKGCYAFFLSPLFAPFILCILVCTHRGKDFWQVCRTWCCMYSSSTYFTLYIKSISSTRSTYWLPSILSIVKCNIKYFLDYFALLFTLLRKSIAVWPDVDMWCQLVSHFNFQHFPLTKPLKWQILCWL